MGKEEVNRVIGDELTTRVIDIEIEIKGEKASGFTSTATTC
jgi:hypothetical protein